jgi:hypothetical protein
MGCEQLVDDGLVWWLGGHLPVLVKRFDGQNTAHLHLIHDDFDVIFERL